MREGRGMEIIKIKSIEDEEFANFISLGKLNANREDIEIVIDPQRGLLITDNNRQVILVCEVSSREEQSEIYSTVITELTSLMGESVTNVGLLSQGIARIDDIFYNVYTDINGSQVRMPIEVSSEPDRRVSEKTQEILDILFN